MGLDHFTSIFELLATFNFAYTLSDHFVKMLNDRMLSGFILVKEKLASLQGSIDLSKTNIHNTKATRREYDDGVWDNSPKLEEIRESVLQHDTAFKEMKSKIDKDIELAGLTKSFKYICFFNALYCIFILVPIGFLSDEFALSLNSSSIKVGLYLANFMSIFFQLRWIRLDRKRIRADVDDRTVVGYKRTLFWFLGCVGVAFAGFLLNYFIVKLDWVNPLCDSCLVWLSLGVPSIHFAWYFNMAYKNSSKRGEEYQKEVTAFRKTFDEWEEQHVNPCIQGTSAMDQFFKPKTRARSAPNRIYKPPPD